MYGPIHVPTSIIKQTDKHSLPLSFLEYNFVVAFFLSFVRKPYIVPSECYVLSGSNLEGVQAVFFLLHHHLSNFE